MRDDSEREGCLAKLGMKSFDDDVFVCACVCICVTM